MFEEDMEKKFEKALENKINDYKKIEIPDNFNNFIEKTVKDNKTNFKTNKKYMKVASGLVVVMIGFTIGVNTSSVFAKALNEIPILSNIANLVTFIEFDIEDKNIEGYVEIPNISMNEPSLEDNKAIKDVNEEIQKNIEYHTNEIIEKGKVYEDNNIIDGVKPSIRYDVDYKIKNQTDEYISFVIITTEIFASSITKNYFYNIDLNTGEKIKIDELLGDDYINIIDKSIHSQINKRMESGVQYFPDKGGFDTISNYLNENGEIPFYINEDKLPVIVFDKYAITSGSEGEVEFVIEK